MQLVFAANPVSIRQSLMRMLAHPPLADLCAEHRGIAELVLAEVLNNVAEHAYAEGEGKVAVTVARSPAGIRCLIIDEGSPMPGERLPEGRLPVGPAAFLADLPEGGFGWHLIRSFCTDLTYVRQDGQNRVAFTLPAKGPKPLTMQDRTAT